MALQGTLDTFALPDVLRLLAATKKTGSVQISGPRGTGTLWVGEGEVGAIDVPHAPHATLALDGLFELLRFDEGSFTFDVDAVPPAATAYSEVEALLTQAEALLAEWREIESVVPSMDAWVTLRRELVAPTVAIDREQWTTVVAVGGGATVHSISDALALPELPVSRAVRDLVQFGLVDIAPSAPAKHAIPTSDAFVPLTKIDPPMGTRLGDPSELPPATAPRLAALTEDEPLPVARPLRARRPRTLDATPGESVSETFVPLDLPGSGPAATYDNAAIEVPPVEEVEAAEGAEPIEHVEPVKAEADDGTAADDGDTAASDRGALKKFLSSVKS